MGKRLTDQKGAGIWSQNCILPSLFLLELQVYELVYELSLDGALNRVGGALFYDGQ